MKKLILVITTLIALGSGLLRAQNETTLFPYPQVPQDMANLYDRCNFLVDKFWERCNFKSAMSSRARLNKAFGDYIGFMPYATVDTVYMSIDRLMESVRKSAEQSAAFAEMAEAWLYSDTAQYRSDELYYRFLGHTAVNKKIPAEQRRRYEAQKRILDNSRVGATLPDIELTKADGSKTTMAADTSDYTLLFIYAPDNFDCTLARTRLSADMVLNQLNDAGIVRVMSLYAGEPDASFNAAVSAMPSGWINVASPMASEIFDLRHFPAIYYLDRNKKVLGKNLEVDNILAAFRSLMNKN